MRTTQNTDSDYVLKLRDELLRAPTENLALAQIRITHSPRMRGEDPAHIRTLTESVTELPPILVHRPTMRVIDGIHRLRAAAERGLTHIQARLFDGSESDSRLLAVALNVAHGLPLSLDDRCAAAERMLVAHRDWSDRAVAAVAGVSARKVAEIRRQAQAAADSNGPGNGHETKDARVGRDGRARPVDPARGRELAAELLRQNPEASLRQIARQAGISPATVADVRDRLARGEGPVPLRRRQAAGNTAAGGAATLTAVQALPAYDRPEPGKSAAELETLATAMRRDPSMRHTERGRAVLRMLDTWAAFARDREAIAASLPPHCRGVMAELVQGYTQTWQLFADELQHGADTCGATTAAC
ncbi:ParB N-terminal domain-containing protein [Streptomyces sp. cmx-4-9]|uniref:ParB/RepB/Spo0J family partition protein n=1 Tax=Streptomyces sp. cmx-4-9 TaxID=2790941 RepID=UPI00397F7406